MIRYIKRVTIAFSILLNTLFGGSNNQTLSARNWELKRNKKINFVWLIDLIFWREKDHCFESWLKWQIINDSIKKYDEKYGFNHKNRKHWYE